MSSQEEGAHHVVPARTYLWVWALLIVLTGITVAVASLDLEKWSRLVAILIASVKASLVVLFFMHVRYEKRIIATILLVTVATFCIFLMLTFTDYPFR